MSVRNGLFSSESVSEGHSDKLADRLSDRVLDAFLTLDPHACVACETLLADQCVVVAGEFKTRRIEDFHAVRESAESLVRQVLRETGYSNASTGIDPDACEAKIRFNGQSSDINQGVDRPDGVLGAGDQGLMSGYTLPGYLPGVTRHNRFTAAASAPKTLSQTAGRASSPAPTSPGTP